MTRLQSSRTMYDRRALPNQGMVASIATRSKAMRDQKSWICVYSICETLGVMVRFNNINMEGMYKKGSPPKSISQRTALSRDVDTTALTNWDTTFLGTVPQSTSCANAHCSPCGLISKRRTGIDQ